MAQVLMPQQRESDLETIMKGLQIAGGIYGIYTNSKDIELKQAQMKDLKARQDKEDASKADKTAGILNEGELGDHNLGGSQVSEIPIPGGIKTRVRSADGGIKDVYIKPKEVIAAEATVANNKTTAGVHLTSEIRSLIGQDFDNYEKVSTKTRDAVDSYHTLQSATLNPDDSGVSDTAALYAFYRVMEPNGRVTESEFDNAQNMQSLPEQVRTMRERLLENKGILSQEVKDQMLTQAGKALDKRMDTQMGQDNRFRRLAKAKGFDADQSAIIDPDFAKFREELKQDLEASKARVKDLGPSNRISGQRIPGENDAKAATSPFNIDDFIRGKE